MDKIRIYSDLASECGIRESGRGVSFEESKTGDIPIITMKITSEEGERLCGRKRGTYVTAQLGKVWLCDEEESERLIDSLAGEIGKMVSSLAPGCKDILIAGLGNREMTPDAIGPMCVSSLTVTRHIKDASPELFEKLGGTSLSAIAPGVTGQTGIESCELVENAVKAVSPSLVIIIDALAARSVERLGTTVQLTDSGIEPGSGIGNKRKGLCRDTLGVPVLVIGVPTVVDSATLVYDALEKAEMDRENEKLDRVLSEGRSFFVSLKESDTAVREMSKILSGALCRAFLKNV